MKSLSRKRCDSLPRGGQIAPIMVLSIFTVLFIAGNIASGQEDGKTPTIDAAWKAEVIDSVLTVLDENYVYPEKAREIIDTIRQKQKNGIYDDITEPRTFTDSLSKHILDVCNDRHVGVRYMPDYDYSNFIPDSLVSDEDKKRLEEEARLKARYENYGFRKVERLDGNVGYLDLRGFEDTRFAGPTAVAAMNFLAGSDAIIIDLRQNGGGSASMIRLISSFLFDEHTHLTSWYWRPSDSITQSFTLDYVPGTRRPDVPVYVLTSRRTFSAAEEFTYNLKNLERATIIGETTGGGAHPVDGFGFESLGVVCRVSIGRAINPVTGTNWEGVGITPHIEVPEAEALDRAHVEALKKIKENPYHEIQKQKISWILDYKQALLNPVEISPELMQKYAGVYGPRTIMVEDGQLYYQREDRPKYRMIAMSEDTFIFEDLEYFRLRIDMDDDGGIVSVTGLYDDGHTDTSPRSP